ncbi:MAG: DUF4864 domain-containing protein [Pseudomonadota bacterium]
MKQLIKSALFALSLAMAPISAKAEDAARQVISDQLEAFQADDFETAFSFASPMIKRLFRTPDRFGAMVRNGYPMVWRPSKVEFVSSETVGAAVREIVLIRDGEGVFYELEYEMIPLEDGWKINGVRVRRSGDGLA